MEFSATENNNYGILFFFFLKDHFHLFVVVCNIVEEAVKCKTLFFKKKEIYFYFSLVNIFLIRQSEKIKWPTYS